MREAPAQPVLYSHPRSPSGSQRQSQALGEQSPARTAASLPTATLSGAASERNSWRRPLVTAQVRCCSRCSERRRVCLRSVLLQYGYRQGQSRIRRAEGSSAWIPSRASGCCRGNSSTYQPPPEHSAPRVTAQPSQSPDVALIEVNTFQQVPPDLFKCCSRS